MPFDCVILEGGGNAELGAWKAFGQWVNTICRESPNSSLNTHCVPHSKSSSSHNNDTLCKKVMTDLSAMECSPIIKESSNLVLSLLKREEDNSNGQSLSERVRCWSEGALQKGLECSRWAPHKWLGQALKGAAPAHRWCVQEDALPDLPLVIRNSQGEFTADPQVVAERGATEWRREWDRENTIGFAKELQSIRQLREAHVRDAGAGLGKRQHLQSLPLVPIQNG